MHRIYLFVGLILFGTFDCTAVPSRFEATDQPLKLKGATGQTAEWLHFFAPEPQTFSYTVDEGEVDATVRMVRIVYPSPMRTPFPENDTIPGELYLPKNADGRVPAAIVLDILDGRAIVPRMMARSLAARGVAAFYFPMPYYNARRPKDKAPWQLIDDNPDNALSPLRQTVMDIRRAKAILASRAEIDPQRIGITGISLGGIVTALAAGVDGDFYRVAPIMAGGDLATIVFHARETHRLREALQQKGLGREEFAKLIAPVEPLNFASRIAPATCLMINAAQDEVIPKTTTMELCHRVGDPVILWMPTGHYSSALFLPNAQQKVADLMLGKEVKSLDFDSAVSPASPIR